jgi:hypothetical protein
VAITLTDVVETAQEKTLETLRASNKALTESVAAWAKPVEGLVPTGPSLSLPKGVPTTQEVVDNAFGFTVQVVEAQRELALGVLNAVSPVLKKLTGGRPVAETKAKSATS